MGTAVGGLGFSIIGGGGGVTAFPLQLGNRSVEQIARAMPASRQQPDGAEKLNTKGILVKSKTF
jgi:hypothetical protein